MKLHIHKTSEAYRKQRLNHVTTLYDISGHISNGHQKKLKVAKTSNVKRATNSTGTETINDKMETPLFISDLRTATDIIPITSNYKSSFSTQIANKEIL